MENMVRRGRGENNMCREVAGRQDGHKGKEIELQEWDGRFRRANRRMLGITRRKDGRRNERRDVEITTRTEGRGKSLSRGKFWYVDWRNMASSTTEKEATGH
jgi:hypothetical protein